MSSSEIDHVFLVLFGTPFVRPWVFWSENQVCSGALPCCLDHTLRLLKCTRMTQRVENWYESSLVDFLTYPLIYVKKKKNMAARPAANPLLEANMAMLINIKSVHVVKMNMCTKFLWKSATKWCYYKQQYILTNNSLTVCGRMLVLN